MKAEEKSVKISGQEYPEGLVYRHPRNSPLPFGGVINLCVREGIPVQTKTDTELIFESKDHRNLIQNRVLAFITT